VSCNQCEDLDLTWEIRSPGELAKAIRVARANLKDGTIVESSYWPKGIIKTENEPFSNIKESGPFEDIIQYYFECPKCCQLYSFSCETYHGSGGEWAPVNG